MQCRSPRAGALAAFFTTLALATHAEEGTSPSRETAAPNAVVEPVIVSAQAEGGIVAKDAPIGVLGDLPLTSTPFSVNVITHELMTDQQASYLGDFLKNDPSAAVGNVVISFASLRGFTLGSDGYLLDGLTLGSLLLDGRVMLPAFERIDVLKGAGAFLNGLGGTASLGGALNYIPKKPTDTPVRDLALVYSSESNVGVEADLGGRFGTNDQFGYRMNLGFRDGDAAVEGQSWRQRGASLALDWRVNSSLLLQGGLYYVDNKNDRLQPFFVGATGPIPDAPDARKNLGPSWSTFDQDSQIGWLRADWSFAPDWSVTLQYGGGQNNRPYDGTQDTRFGVITNPAGDIALFASEESSHTTVQTGQALVHGKLSTGPIQHAVTFGATGFQEKNYSSFESAGVVLGSLYTPNEQPQPASVPIADTPYNGKTTSYGLLASDILSFGEHWSVLLGGRQAEVTAYDSTNEELPGGKISRFSPVTALMFKPTPSSLIYINYAEGLEPGGTAPQSAVNGGAIMAPLVTKQYELGAKLMARGISLTAAVFDMRKPLQITDASNTFVQNGHQVHDGAELVATGNLTKALRIVAGAMFLDAKQENTGDPTTEGKRVPGVPQWTANLFLDYAIKPIPGLFLNAGAYYTASQYFDPQNLQSIPAWVRFDVGARYETRVGGRPTTFFLAVENLADKDYWASAQGQALTLGDPLTVKATARVSF